MKRVLCAVALVAAAAVSGCAGSRLAAPIPVRDYSYHQDTGEGWAQGRFQYRRRHGRWVFFDRTGRKTCEGDYEYGLMQGTWRFYFVDGDVLSVAYRDGVSEGSANLTAKK